MKKTLKEYRALIKKEYDYVDIKEHSHNMISLTLSCISKHYGKENVIKAIKDFHLEDKGWQCPKSK